MSRLIDILTMGDSVKAYHEMQEENKPTNYVARDHANYVWVLDFTDGNVYRYDISILGNEENGWNPDSESCEAFLYGAGHKVNDCEWMVTTNRYIETDKPM